VEAAVGSPYSLVTAAKLSIDTFNQAASQRAELSQTEAAQHDELVALQARTDTLAAEFERLRSHKDFRFARETDDADVFDLPQFLPSSPQLNAQRMRWGLQDGES